MSSGPGPTGCGCDACTGVAKDFLAEKDPRRYPCSPDKCPEFRASNIANACENCGRGAHAHRLVKLGGSDLPKLMGHLFTERMKLGRWNKMLLLLKK
jgi:hypothetical protein